MSVCQMYHWLRDYAAIGGVRRSRLVTAWYALKCWWLLRRWASER